MFLKIKERIVFWKTEFSSANYGLNILLTNKFLKMFSQRKYNFKYTTLRQKYSLYITCFASFIVFYYLFANSLHKETSPQISILSIVYFEYLLYNVLHSVRNTYC